MITTNVEDPSASNYQHQGSFKTITDHADQSLGILQQQEQQEEEEHHHGSVQDPFSGQMSIIGTGVQDPLGHPDAAAAAAAAATATEHLPGVVNILEQKESADGLTTSTTLTLDIIPEEEDEAEENVEEQKSSGGRRLIRRKNPDDSKGGAAKAAPVRKLKGSSSSGYKAYSPELRAKIGKYALEHGNQETIAFFLRDQGIRLPESTVRNIRDKYLMR